VITFLAELSSIPEKAATSCLGPPRRGGKGTRYLRRLCTPLSFRDLLEGEEEEGGKGPGEHLSERRSHGVQKGSPGRSPPRPRKGGKEKRDLDRCGIEFHEKGTRSFPLVYCNCVLLRGERRREGKGMPSSQAAVHRMSGMADRVGRHRQRRAPLNPVSPLPSQGGKKKKKRGETAHEDHAQGESKFCFPLDLSHNPGHDKGPKEGGLPCSLSFP